MPTLRIAHMREYFQRHRLLSMIAGQVIILSMLALALLSHTFGGPLSGVFASANCGSGDTTYTIAAGDTLGTIATRYASSVEQLTSHNQIDDPNLIFADQQICIPNLATSFNVSVQNLSTSQDAQQATHGQNNPYPYGQCTWWASERYHQLYGVYIPWSTNADAWQWSMRANEFHWHVSSQPSVGSIVDLQPGVQGAFNLGHVAVVEQILANGHVIASNMNWAGSSANVVNVDFVPGPGVTFITI